MQITIGSTSDDKRKLSKSFSGTNITAKLKQPCDILNPIFIISYDKAYMTANYIYVPDFARYYFINNISVMPGNRAELSCSVDVLMSYQQAIKSLKVDVERQEHLTEPYLPDPSYVYLNTYDVINLLPELINSSFLQNAVSGADYFILGVSGAPNAHINDIDGFTELESEPSDWQLRYMFYFVNTSSNDNPQMEIIGNLITQGQISASDASSFATVQLYYGHVYARV